MNGWMNCTIFIKIGYKYNRFNAADKVIDNTNILILYLLRLKDGEGGGGMGKKGKKVEGLK